MGGIFDKWARGCRYKSHEFVVKVWDIGGASVGMLALPLMLMFVGMELQGDLPPSNYKPLAVFVGCVNIFTSSIFLFVASYRCGSSHAVGLTSCHVPVLCRYATNWDAYDRNVTKSHMAPLFIMLVLCVWAMVVVVCYGVIVPYSDAVWIKILADPDQHQPFHDPEAGWKNAGPGGQGRLALTPLKSDQDSGDSKDPEPTPLPPPNFDGDGDEGADAKAEGEDDGDRQELDPNFVITARVVEQELADVVITWDAPPGTKAREIQCVPRMAFRARSRRLTAVLWCPHLVAGTRWM